MGDEDSSVRVGLRIRPQIPREVIDMCRVCTSVTPGEPQVQLGPNKSFTFDHVFDTISLQEDIYETCVASLIDGALKGYNATVLAYGQTGSGKTYTMGTGFETDIRPDQVGIIPRAIDHLFNGIADLERSAQEEGRPAASFAVTAQFMELYNEEIVDLFEAADGFKLKGSVKIHEDPGGGINVVGVTSKPVPSAKDALRLLRTGALSRTTASTQMNSESSRSHAIFTLIIKQQRLVTSEFLNGDEGGEGSTELETLSAKFHFVDLAGSERLKRTKATGDRAKEGISINCGLLALGNVISALGDKSRKVLHVPYRDSKLTRLLQDSLGGNSRTLMIACVSPSDRDFMETLNTLKYANRARNIKNRVTINQDSSSKMIVALRSQVLQLEQELAEYKQGKRMVGPDGEEAVNDMFHENTMLQSEMNNMRTRVKAMQETIDVLKQKNTALLTEQACGRWGALEDQPEVTDIIKEYLSEIEDLRSKLLESEKTCEMLRKKELRPSFGLMSPRPTNNLDMSLGDSAVGSLLEEAKKDVAKDLCRLRNKEAMAQDEKPGSDGEGSDSDSEDGDDDDATSADSDVETEPTEEFACSELAHLTTEISTKQKLIDQLELSQRRIHVIKQQYEEKLHLLQTRIRLTQDERDKMMASYTGPSTQKADKQSKTIRDEYERKLTNLTKELRKLQQALKKHEQMAKMQTRSEVQLKSLRNELTEMKRAKVKLISRMKEESARHKMAEDKRNREIAQLRKETRKHETRIRNMEADRKMKEVVLRRRNEEVNALRRTVRTKNMSSKAAGRLPPKHDARSPAKQAKLKWQALEKNITRLARNKQAVATMEQDMERQLRERESLCQLLETLIRQRQLAATDAERTDFTEQIEGTRANIEYIQVSIAESQQEIVSLEEAKEEGGGDAGGGDGSMEVSTLVQTVGDVDEAHYLIQKLYNMTVNQSYSAAQKDMTIQSLEAEMLELRQTSRVQEELLKHMLERSEMDVFAVATEAVGTGGEMARSMAESSGSSPPSSRSTSPVEMSNGMTLSAERVRSSSYGRKIRRRTALPSELLYPDTHPYNMLPEANEPQLLPLARNPSAPDTLRMMTSSMRLDPLKLASSPVLPRKTLDRQESTSPRSVRRNTILLPQSSLFKTGSMEQGLDASPPNSPTSQRRAVGPRDENVFSRLTNTMMTSPQNQFNNKGIIAPYQGKASLRAALVCTHVAKGHVRAVLSVDATNDLLFSASKDRTVKVWDLRTGTESQTLQGHPNNVLAVKYHEDSRLVFSMSSYMVKVWDLRDSSKCIWNLCSSGMTTAGVVVAPSTAAAARTMQFPQGESQLNAMSLNQAGSLLYTAAGEKVRVWDLRRFESTKRLSGGHQAAVMCLAVGRRSADEDVVITGSKDHYIKVFEVDRRSEAANFVPTMNLEPPHYDGIQSLAIAGNILFSGSRDTCIKKWNLADQELVQSQNNAHKDWVTCLAFMPGGQKLLSACRSGVVKVWAADSFTQIGEVKAHSESINAVTTNKTGVIFTASNSGEVRFWRWPIPSAAMTMSTGRAYQLES